MSISKLSCSVFFILLAFFFWKYFLLLTYSLSKNYKFSIPTTKWAQMDLNHRPHAYQACALTN